MFSHSILLLSLLLRHSQKFKKRKHTQCSFAEEHATSSDMRQHTFTITKQSRAEPLRCVVCAELATRRCLGPQISRLVFDDLKGLVAEATQLEGTKEAYELPTLRAVKDFVEEHGLPFSHERCAVLHQECCGGVVPTRNKSEFWRAFEKELESAGSECNDTYCAEHWVETHKKGRRARHRWLGFAAGAAGCVMCETAVAERHCEVCVDDLCTSCALSTHLRGKKHRHDMTPIKEPLPPVEKKGQKGQRSAPQYCSICEIRAGSVECPLCEVPLCDSCLEFKHDDVCAKAHERIDPNKPEICAVCQKHEPVQMCVECGDVYCNEKWMGNPGCFVKSHLKGNRRNHTRVEYTHMAEKRRKEELEKKRAKIEERKAARQEALAMEEERKRHENLMAAQSDREERILAEAKKIIEDKKKKSSLIGAFVRKLPGLSSLLRGGGTAGPAAAAKGGGDAGGVPIFVAGIEDEEQQQAAVASAYPS